MATATVALVAMIRPVSATASVSAAKVSETPVMPMRLAAMPDSAPVTTPTRMPLASGRLLPASSVKGT